MGAGALPTGVECPAVCSTSGDWGSGTLDVVVAILQVCPQGRCADAFGLCFPCWLGGTRGWASACGGMGAWGLAGWEAHGGLSLLGPASCVLGLAWFLVTCVGGLGLRNWPASSRLGTAPWDKFWGHCAKLLGLTSREMG